MTLTRVPRIRGFDKHSRPPVEEMTSNLPATQSPLWNRSTAGVYSAARTRGARPASDGGGQVICLTGSIVLIPRCVGDYERPSKARLPWLVKWPRGRIARESRRIFGGDTRLQVAVVQSLSRDRFAGKTVCLGRGMGALAMRSRQRIAFKTAVLMASGRVKFIFADAAEP